MTGVKALSKAGFFYNIVHIVISPFNNWILNIMWYMFHNLQIFNVTNFWPGLSWHWLQKMGTPSCVSTILRMELTSQTQTRSKTPQRRRSTQTAAMHCQGWLANQITWALQILTIRISSLQTTRSIRKYSNLFTLYDQWIYKYGSILIVVDWTSGCDISQIVWLPCCWGEGSLQQP